MPEEYRPAADDGDARTLLDAERAVLASPAGCYRRYIAALRVECGCLSDEQFRTRRSGELTEILLSPDIFLTDHARKYWHTAAIRNLSAELRSLTVPTGDGALPADP